MPRKAVQRLTTPPDDRSAAPPAAPMPRGGARVLVVDDDVEMTELLRDLLRAVGHRVDVATDGGTALTKAAHDLPDLVITDLRMDGVDGFDVLAGVHELDAEIPVVVLTAFGGVDSAVEAMRRGAFHYLLKPYNVDDLTLQVARALEARRLRAENRTLRRRVAIQSGLEGIVVGTSRVMRDLASRIERFAQAHATVLIRGESGTGKELVAQALHRQSPRAEGPFIAVNCSALPEALLESELFGHVKGAFTGASTSRRGLFAQAQGGTILLDEIGDMQPNLQAKLLRVLETSQIRSVGADATMAVDVRVLASTHQPLERRIEEETFRADLYYRLSVLTVEVPPLREHLEDLPILAEHFLARARERNEWCAPRRFSSELMHELMRRDWPGNVRELESTIEQLAVLGDAEELSLRDLFGLTSRSAGTAVPPPLADARRSRPKLKDAMESYIGWVIEDCAGNLSRAADVLGIDRSTLHRRKRTPNDAD